MTEWKLTLFPVNTGKQMWFTAKEAAGVLLFKKKKTKKQKMDYKMGWAALATITRTEIIADQI